MQILKPLHRPVPSVASRFRRQWPLYVLLLPTLVYVFIFKYLPMTGLVIAFQDFKPAKGIWGSNFVGLKHFTTLLGRQQFMTLLKNTLTLSLYSLIAGFPLPILLALGLNGCPSSKFRRTVQTVTYAPHFISTVVLCGMVNIFFSPSTGIVQNLLNALGLHEGYLYTLIDPQSFPHLYVWSGVWQGMGWGSIVYLSALTGVDPSLHEAATVDGATKLQRVWHIDLLAILPTIVVLLILRVGDILSVGFEKAFLLQNAMNTSTSEIISTYVYKLGLKDGRYSLATAVGLFESVVSFALLIAVNALSRRLTENSLW